MSQILINLGCDDVKLFRKSDGRSFDSESLKEITSHFLKIEAIAKGLAKIRVHAYEISRTIR